MPQYQVIVSNVGTVYTGTSRAMAYHEWDTYRKASQAQYGRIAGESVTLMSDGEIIEEYQGTQGAD